LNPLHLLFDICRNTKIIHTRSDVWYAFFQRQIQIYY
jgi:hypothetical protein